MYIGIQLLFGGRTSYHAQNIMDIVFYTVHQLCAARLLHEADCACPCVTDHARVGVIIVACKLYHTVYLSPKVFKH